MDPDDTSWQDDEGDGDGNKDYESDLISYPEVKPVKLPPMKRRQLRGLLKSILSEMLLEKMPDDSALKELFEMVSDIGDISGGVTYAVTGCGIIIAAPATGPKAIIIGFLGGKMVVAGATNTGLGVVNSVTDTLEFFQKGGPIRAGKEILDYLEVFENNYGHLLGNPDPYVIKP